MFTSEVRMRTMERSCGSCCHQAEHCMLRIKQRKYKGTGNLPLNAWQYERFVALERFGEDYLAGWLADYGVCRPKTKRSPPTLSGSDD